MTQNSTKTIKLVREASVKSHQGEHNPYWNSSLFNEVYLRNDVPTKYSKEWSESSDFEIFQNEFHNFVDDLKIEEMSNWSESDTIDNWIVPIMEMLGWHDKCERKQNPYIKELSFTVRENSKPKIYRLDLAYVDEPKFKKYTTDKKNSEEKIIEAQNELTGIQMVVEAKYWDRLEQYKQEIDEDKRRADIESGDGPRSLSPDDQILKYIEIVNRDFGILTDGKTWRLYHKTLSKGDIRRYFEYDLGNIKDLLRSGIDNEIKRDIYLDELKYFYFIFRKKAFVSSENSLAFSFELLEYSKKYASDIENDLRSRFIVAMGYACNAMQKSASKFEKIEIGLEHIRNTAESNLFTILFIRSCETRKILPIHAPDYLRISLSEIIESLHFMKFDPQKDIQDFLPYFKKAFGPNFTLESTELFDRLLLLYKTVQDGEAGLTILGFKQSLFSHKEWDTAQKLKIDNHAMILTLFALNFTQVRFGDKKYQQIPYSLFTPRQLGSIFESFLEYRLQLATTNMVFVKNEWIEADLGSKKVLAMKLPNELVVREGSLYFTSDSADRKETGAYYTPDYVVQNMVVSSLSNIVATKTSDQILGLRICDPAIGSGHFLNGALRFLTDAFRAKKSEELMSDLTEPYQESARRILESCLYGIDLNSRALKLAKMSLWLVTAYAGKKLERLDGQLLKGNSLDPASFDWTSKFSGIAFDLIIGNPPYSGNSLNDNKWINGLIDDYRTVDGKPLNEKKVWLKNDYVKFLRLAQWAISNQGSGSVCFITDHSYLDSPTFRGMRENLFKFFDSLTVVNLHGNTKRKEISPDGSKDENVFAIKEGVAICMLTKNKKSKISKSFKYVDIWGTQEQKEKILSDHLEGDFDYTNLTPMTPFYLYTPTELIENSLQEESSWAIPDMFLYGSNGIQTSRDFLVVDFEKEVLEERISDFASEKNTLNHIRKKYFNDASDKEFEKGDSEVWKVSIARESLKDSEWKNDLIPYKYRPFDERFILYRSDMVHRTRSEVMAHMLNKNIALCVGRAGIVISGDWDLVYAVDSVCDHNLFYRGSSLNFPMYLHKNSMSKKQMKSFDDQEMQLNFSKKFQSFLISIYGPSILSEEGPYKIFGYIYAMLNSKTFREKNRQALQHDYPKVFFTNDKNRFQTISEAGMELLQLHMDGSESASKHAFQGKGDDIISPGYPIFDNGKLHINENQYFLNVSREVWEYRVGGYVVLQKWLKDRSKRNMTLEDLNQFKQILQSIEDSISKIESCEIDIRQVLLGEANSKAA